MSRRRAEGQGWRDRRRASVLVAAALLAGCAGSPAAPTPGVAPSGAPSAAPSTAPPVAPTPSGSADWPDPRADLAAIACPADVALDMPAKLEAAVREATGNGPTCLRLRPGAAPFGLAAVTGAEAQSAWERLRQPAAAVGWWPVIMDPEGYVSLVDAREIVETEPMEALAAAGTIDVAAWLETRTAKLGLPDADDGTRPDPEPVREIDLAIARDVLTGTYLPEVSIVLVPAERSADVAGHLLYGCWNDNPCPAEHVAVLRRWEDRYGAHVASMGSVVELVVDRPPDTWDAAIELAREMYVYDYDIVDQGTGSINVLAALLVGAPQWFFWWD